MLITMTIYKTVFVFKVKLVTTMFLNIFGIGFAFGSPAPGYKQPLALINKKMKGDTKRQKF